MEEASAERLIALSVGSHTFADCELAVVKDRSEHAEMNRVGEHLSGTMDWCAKSH